MNEEPSSLKDILVAILVIFAWAFAVTGLASIGNAPYGPFVFFSIWAALGIAAVAVNKWRPRQ